MTNPVRGIRGSGLQCPWSNCFPQLYANSRYPCALTSFGDFRQVLDHIWKYHSFLLSCEYCDHRFLDAKRTGKDWSNLDVLKKEHTIRCHNDNTSDSTSTRKDSVKTMTKEQDGIFRNWRYRNNQYAIKLAYESLCRSIFGAEIQVPDYKYHYYVPDHTINTSSREIGELNMEYYTSRFQTPAQSEPTASSHQKPILNYHLPQTQESLNPLSFDTPMTGPVMQFNDIDSTYGSSLYESSIFDSLEPNQWQPDPITGDLDQTWLFRFVEALLRDAGLDVLSNETFQRVDAMMAHETPDAMRNIRYGALRYLPSSHQSHWQDSSPTSSVGFHVDWDPLDYISKQYDVTPWDFPGTALTLTGSFTDAQSATCMEYMKQTWPSSGEHTVALLKKVILSPGWNDCTLPDDTSVLARIFESKLEIVVRGVEDSIAEIGEQIAWIAAALRLAPGDRGVFGCIPYIQRIPEYPQSAVPGLDHSLEAIFSIKFYFLDDRAERYSNGQCWHDLFKNPILVQGYPIPFRPRHSQGLEISIDILADLIEAPGISLFGDKLFLKGFCSMLTPTNQYGDTIVWHLIHNDEGKHISYLDTHEYNVPGRIVLEDVMASKHIVGWCQEANFYTGTAKATYPVQKPFLSPTTADCLLHGIKVPQGRTIITQHLFERARRDKPPYIPEEAMLHLEKVNLLKDKHVVLWDVGDKRGWLVNGVDAWSHLLHAQLKHQFEDDDDYGPELVEPPNPYKARSTFDILKNPENMKLVLIEDEYEGSTRLRTVQHVSDRIFHMLELLMDHQTVAVRQRTRFSRKYLSGWAFRDLAKERELEPFAIELADVGKSWVDFIRAISAVTLFGQDFGELIVPRNPCKRWKKLPTGQFYLAASGLVLNRIIADVGSSPDQPRRLGRDIVWHNPTWLCKCGEGKGDHSDVTQVLLPEDVSRDESQMTNRRKVEDDSAVIFGYNSEQSWVWHDFGNPSRGSSSALSMHDSGLGSEPDRSGNTPLNSSAYTVGIVCALSMEGAAMEELFNEVHQRIENYVLGCIGEHHVVLAYLSGQYGITAAATAAKELGNRFRSIDFGLLVGIAGGCPSEENDIRLGDVVVSSPKYTHPGVIQYDLGKRLTNGAILRTGALKLPPNHLLGTVASLIEDLRDYSRFKELIESVGARNTKYQHPGQKEDIWKSAPCGQCQNGCIDSDSHISKRKARDSDSPTIHRGLIGSGNMVIRDSTERDRLTREYGILCVDMEAAGVMHNTVEIPFIVVRGISDYADSHKNDQWHNYAAVTAAAFARVLLERVGGIYKSRGSGCFGSKRDLVADDKPEMSVKRRKN
ncbi:hypothetical protein E0Z10_g3386 [Xylaria hypoxylon]|uniref:Nucleoside phosphorylase domain-containing protein n=1 Tax=Xylaria hypoxylon TaxID=37992 RepID=A0A4Z0Z1U6_9PEZI|nr:hypothetical protein E0Z10_g3386 [Xylaria hypoxylon]